MQKILYALLLVMLAGTASVYAQSPVGTIELEGGKVKVKAAILGFQTNTQVAEVSSAMGRRLHGPITITRVIDGTSPELQQVALTGEVLKTVTILLGKPSARKDGYLQIKLTNATISGMSLSAGVVSGQGPSPTNDPIEVLSFTYQNIQYVYSDSKTVFNDQWVVK